MNNVSKQEGKFESREKRKKNAEHTEESTHVVAILLLTTIMPANTYNNQYKRTFTCAFGSLSCLLCRNKMYERHKTVQRTSKKKS